MAKGWVSIHRQIWDSWVWKDRQRAYQEEGTEEQGG